MKDLYFFIFIFTFFISQNVSAQKAKSEYLNFEKTIVLIESNPDSAYQEILFFEPNSIQSNYLLGIYYKYKKEFKQSKNHLLYSMLENLEVNTEKYFDTYYHLAYAYRRLGIMDSAQYYFSKSIELGKKYDNKTIVAKSYGGLSIVFRQQNQVDSAIHYINLSEVEYKHLNDTTGLARVQNTLGNLYRIFDTKLAIGHYQKALDLYEQLGKEKEVAIIKQNLGLILSDEGKYTAALDYLKAALLFFENRSYLQYQIICLNNIGFTYLNTENYSNAEDNLLKAIEINTEYATALSYSCANLGAVYNKLEKYTKARKYLLKALQIAKENNQEYLLLEIYNNLISVSSALSDHKNVKKYFKVYNKINDHIQNKNIEDALAKYENDLEKLETQNLLKLAIKDKKLREQEIEEKKSEIFSKNILLSLGIIIISLLIIIVFIIYRSDKKKKALNISIRKKNRIINKYNTELESIVEERTEELLRAKNKAEESDILKSTFLANISHEIRTPLNSIMGFSDLLSETDLDLENTNNYGKIIRQNGFELLNIIDDIIDVSKIEANMYFCEIKPMKHSIIINNIINENYEKSKFFNKSETIDFSTHFVKEELWIKGDLYKLNIVFNKLINNAFQFTEKGFVDISSRIEDKKVRFSVSDSGIGIPKERLPQIFENFRKFQKDNHFKYRGLGVGLYIAHNILLRMGSQLEIDSINGKGSTFSFLLDITHETE